MHDPLLGTTIDGRFEIRRLIGTGGMGVVYEGFHLILQTPIAVKVLSQETSFSKEALQRFQSEARFASSLSHPNIVMTHAFGVQPEVGPYIVMELLDGNSLADALEQTHILPKARFIAVFQQCCAALETIHKQGVIHRDIKPSNIMLVKRSGNADLVKLTDFGIAKVFGERDIQSLTRTGEILGTPVYMSPEQCEGKPVDQRSDIYSLGCVMYEALTGKPPFQAVTPLEVMMKHVHDEPVTPSNIDSALAQVVMHALEKRPVDRQQSMAQLLEELDDAAGGILPAERRIRFKIPDWLPKAAIGAIAAVLLAPVVLPAIHNYFVVKEKPPISLALTRYDLERAKGRLTSDEVNVLRERCAAVENAFIDNPENNLNEMAVACQIRDALCRYAIANKSTNEQIRYYTDLKRAHDLLKGTSKQPKGYSNVLQVLGLLIEQEAAGVDYHKRANKYYDDAIRLNEWIDIEEK